MGAIVGALLCPAAALTIVPSAIAAKGDRPDLRPQNLSLGLTEVAPGGDLSLSFAIKNRGNARSGKSRAGFFLSRDARRDRRDVALGSTRIKALAASRSARRRVGVQIPDSASPGNRFLIVCADTGRRVRESDERRNCRAVRLSVTAPPGPNPGPGPPAPAPTGKTFNLTLNQDIFTGTDLEDLFVANLEFNPGTGTNISTLQTGDNLNGGGAKDTLSATLNFAAPTTVTPTITNVETVGLTDVGSSATTLAATNVTGASDFNLSNSTNANPFAVTGLSAPVNLGLSSQAVGASLDHVAGATSGGADATTIKLSNVTGTDAIGATVNLTTAANGFEEASIVSNGSGNRLRALTQTTGTSLSALDLSGPAPLRISRIGPLPSTLTSIDSGSATGGTDVTVGGALPVAYAGGSGNDTVNFAGTYTSADVINGGAGANTLGLNASQAAVVVPQGNVSNVANIMIVNTLLGETVDVARFGATDVILDTSGSALLLNLPSTVRLPAGNRTITLNNDDVNDQLDILVSGAGVNDTLTINANNSDHTFGGTSIRPLGAETVRLVSTNGLDGTAADGAASTFVSLVVNPTGGAGVLQLSGSVEVRVSGVVTAGTIDASGLGAPFTMETSTAFAGASSSAVIGSAFSDELVGGSGNDGVNGGAGNDQIKGALGTDALAGDGGSDRFYFDATNQFGDTIGDLVAGSDQVGFGSGIINFAGVAGTENASVTLGAANFETGRSAITAIAAGDALKVVRMSGAQTSTQINGDVGAAVAAYVLVFDSTLQRGVLVHDADWSSAAGRTRVATLDNITSLAALQALTAAEFAEID